MRLNRDELELELSKVQDFETSKIEYEQYMTPADIAATLVHIADMNGDLKKQIIVDLGTGTGMLALGVLLRGPKKVIGIDIDPNALFIAKKNRRILPTDMPVDWILGDVKNNPIKVENKSDVTVIMNPPFGAQRRHRNADRVFLEAASKIGSTSYSIHNCDSIEFIRTFVNSRGGKISQSYSIIMEIKNSQKYHTKEKKKIRAEAHRIVWK